MKDAGDRAALCAELDRQSRALPASRAREAGLRRLRQGAPAVITGQQVGFFLGPAYTIYKAATAVAEARERDAVPVFWLQAEDHDADEVGLCRVLDASGATRTVRLQPMGPARASLAHRPLGSAIDQALAEMSQALEEAPHRDATLALLREAYRPERGWAEAFGHLLAQLFADEGLVVFQPRTAAIATLAEPIHRWAIREAERIDALLAASEVQQVPHRRGCLLSFFHPEGPEGPRFRPARDDGGYRWPGAGPSMSASDLLETLSRAPMRFSTSALLRPVLQDRLFDTAAYVGGPSELRYLEQVKPLHAACGLAMPPAVARARLLVTDPACRRRLSALGLAAVDFDAPMNAILARLRLGIEGSAEAATVRDEILGPALAELERLRGDLADPTLERAFSRTRRTLERSLSRLAERIEQARLRGDETFQSRITFLLRRLRPDDELQERWLGFPHFAAWFGPRRFVEAAIGAVGADRAIQELPAWP